MGLEEADPGQGGSTPLGANSSPQDPCCLGSVSGVERHSCSLVPQRSWPGIPDCAPCGAFSHGGRNLSGLRRLVINTPRCQSPWMARSLRVQECICRKVHHFEDESKRLFTFIDRKLFFKAAGGRWAMSQVAPAPS